MDNGAEARRDALVERIVASALGTFDIFSIYLGDRLGLYRSLADSGWATPTELAASTGTAERYVREWLEEQTVAGILETEDASAEPGHRRFRLPSGHDEVLVDQESLNYIAPLARLLVGATRPLPAILDAYRSGGGVPFGDYGVDVREGQAGVNRAMFLHQLGSEWIPAMPDVFARLSNGSPARVADIGCGAGWSSIGIAQAFPSAKVDGFDLDAPSIALARTNCREHGLEDRVTFHLHDASDTDFAGAYDLVTAFECVHDMADPVGALRTMKHLAGESGAVLIADERVADAFDPGAGDIERMMYGWSVLHCLPASMAEQPSAATGTVLRTSTLERYAHEAGFSSVEVLPIDNFFFRFYRLR